jgi:hypothetical protein
MKDQSSSDSRKLATVFLSLLEVTLAIEGRVVLFQDLIFPLAILVAVCALEMNKKLCY